MNPTSPDPRQQAARKWPNLRRVRAWLWLLRLIGLRKTFGYWQAAQERGWMSDEEARSFRQWLASGEGKAWLDRV